MDLRQSIAQTNTLLLPPKPYSIPPISSLPLNPKPVGRGRTARAGRIKCSFDYNVSAATNTGGLYDYERHAAPGSQYPRPAEIQWKKELCNSVQLIGLVGAPVQIKHLPSGKVVAWSRIAVKKSPTDTVWVNLTFWDELANVAFEHVEKGNQIYVSGRLISDTVENDDGKKQTYYKVVVQQLNFVEQSFSSSALHNGSPDSATSGKRQTSYSENSTSYVEELWQAFFANPMEWWDNRKNKRSPNYPDFKHKDTGEALWVEGRNNPPWVKSQLSVLDSRMESIRDQSPVSFMAADSLGLGPF
ncbi:protein OSB2, chloroplastic-like isoform X1 [Andrographis paniculata]|uniref:protein OSB2, chloroplastic-like isoform X1 n=1 Tax=Andrographis paniculata TaxID=175694 RepID=UPI0021E7A37B|nr:protein OSB2, chloroplastic-like isoform X1 [Andrographis paniculata]